MMDHLKQLTMPSIIDKQTITTLTKDQFDLIKSLGITIRNVNGSYYYHLPKYFKYLGAGEFEVINFEDLPENVQGLAETDRVKQILRELKVTDELYEDIKRLLQAIPECPVHGDMCIPNALIWINEKKKG